MGAFTAVCANEGIAAKALSQMKLDIRAMYSNPPVHGARIVATVAADPALTQEWYAFHLPPLPLSVCSFSPKDEQ